MPGSPYSHLPATSHTPPLDERHPPPLHMLQQQLQRYNIHVLLHEGNVNEAVHIHKLVLDAST